MARAPLPYFLLIPPTMLTLTYTMHNSFLTRLNDLILSHLQDTELDVPTLCEGMGLSRTALHSRLKSQTGMSTTEYVRHIRLTHACHMLLHSDLHVSEVAYRCGFHSHTYFSRCFRAVHRMSPREYREKKMQSPRTD